MPPLSEAFPAIARALAVGRRPAAAGPDRFEAVAAFIAAGRAAGTRRGDRLASALEGAGLLDPAVLATAPPEEVVDALRDARVEAAPKTVRLLQRLAAWYLAHRDALEAEPGEAAFPRDALAEIRGVGRATADALALHVFGRAAYPVDRATYRIFVRHGWIDVTVDYDEAAGLIVDAAREDPSDLAALSNGLADVGRRFCKPSGPRCEPCPLRVVLPDGGPIEIDG